MFYFQGPTQVTTRQRSTAHAGSRQLCGEARVYPTFCCLPPYVFSLLEEQRGGLHVGVTVHRKTVILDPHF
jgi:hypothetical protein